jgi:uroporphyrinogen decarboxylase
METLSPRERFMTAMTNGIPDRVPATPDISNMIPARRTGKPFWELYYFNEPPVWQAYIDAVKYFGIDGWFIYGDMQWQWPGDRHEAILDLRKTADRWIVRSRCRIDDVHYEHEEAYFVADPPTWTFKPVQDIAKDWKIVEKILATPVGCNPSLLRQQRASLGDLGAFGVHVGYPGFQNWFQFIGANGIEEQSYVYFDNHDLIEEMRVLQDQQSTAQMEMVLEERPDFVILGGSGTITLQSPSIARELSLPTIKKLTAMAKQAGIPTLLHSCGKERQLVKWLAEETDLNCVNPLEVLPQGDCELTEIKRTYGKRLALMGNLHTTDVMRYGTPQDVKRACLKAIFDAGQDGGFILSTGDQCGRDTPDENIFTMVDITRTFGQYPLDMDRIQEELKKT